MQWYSRIDPETNQVLVGFRTVVTMVVAVMIIAFADDIKRLVIDAETSGVMEVNTRQNIEMIVKNVMEHEIAMNAQKDRILKLEFSNRDHLRLQRQISANTNLIRKIQTRQIEVVGKISNMTSNNRKIETRVGRLERQ